MPQDLRTGPLAAITTRGASRRINLPVIRPGGVVCHALGRPRVMPAAAGSGLGEGTPRLSRLPPNNRRYDSSNACRHSAARHNRRPGGNPVGERLDLRRYRIPPGVRIVYGERVDGGVRFLPREPGVADVSSGDSEDSACCSRERLRDHQPTDPASEKRPGDGEPAATARATAAEGGQREGVRVELARYTGSGGERVLYGHRVFGV
jgi:hypothetical protein